ncbi:Uncharacterized protein HA466_0303820 [Hirschfeldia incana]|nr:Uncharacterized protein HA466_0303820 [Hirschfeldia incana]
MVWWDIKSCPVPEGYDPLLVRRSIESVLSDKQYRGPLTIIALGNLEDIPLEDLQAYSSSGIVMKHDPFVESSCTENREGTTITSLMEEVRRWTFFNPAPASIVFISNPQCLLRFSYQMNCLSTREYNILLTFESAPLSGYIPPRPTKFLWKDLLKDAVRKSVWDQDSTGKKIEEKFTCEPGGIFCIACNSDSRDGRIEDGDLTAHLTSETHELEMIGNSPKNIFEHDLSLLYKWGAYTGIPRERMDYILKGHPELVKNEGRGREEDSEEEDN